MSTHNDDSHYQGADEDVKQLHSMGYAQELSRRMGGFQNFAISFSIICILAGGITAFPVAFSAAGGASIGFGWLIAGAFALLVATALAQVASAYPTAGGIYHWASILGGRGWGWAAAWFNLLGLLFVVSSVNFGVFFLFRDLFLGIVLEMDVTSWIPVETFDQGWWTQTIFITVITISQAMFNHAGIKATTILTDFSGYLILAGAVVLTVALVAFAPVDIDISRLFTFTNFTGDAGGGLWPAHGTILFALLLGLLQGVYTVTGFDASGHTSEETRQAAKTVPKGMIHSVLWSVLFGYVMVCSFVLAMPSVEEGAATGWGSFNYAMLSSEMPHFLLVALIIVIVVANYLCALAGLTSTSRMLFAFARDGGVPFSGTLRKVSPKHRTPAAAIWVGAILSVAATLYGDAFLVLSTGCAVFLYISYVMAVGAGLYAETKGTWKDKGPFNLGGLSKLVALLAIVGCAVLIFVGVQPPQERVGYLVAALAAVLIVAWFAFEGRRFKGPPIGDEVARRQAEIAKAEKAIGQG